MSDVPADPPITYVKKQYTTIVAERVIDAPRQVAWDAMLALLVESTGGYVAEGDPARARPLAAPIALRLPGPKIAPVSLGGAFRCAP